MPKRINTKGRTIGELNGLYAKYQNVFNIILSTPEKTGLGNIMTILQDINDARKEIRKQLEDYIEKEGGISYWDEPNEYDTHATKFYEKFIEDWDSERCTDAIVLSHGHSSVCKKAIHTRLKMLELLGL